MLRPPAADGPAGGQMRLGLRLRVSDRQCRTGPCDLLDLDEAATTPITARSGWGRDFCRELTGAGWGIGPTPLPHPALGWLIQAALHALGNRAAGVAVSSPLCHESARRRAAVDGAAVAGPTSHLLGCRLARPPRGGSLRNEPARAGTTMNRTRHLAVLLTGRDDGRSRNRSRTGGRMGICPRSALLLSGLHPHSEHQESGSAMSPIADSSCSMCRRLAYTGVILLVVANDAK